MKNPHQHATLMDGGQVVTGPPDDGSNPNVGQEATVGGHTGTVINSDPWGAKRERAQGHILNLPLDPTPDDWTASEQDITIRLY